MSKRKIFINLTNGIEALENYDFLNENISFIRILSTHCERSNFERILENLDSNFLLHLALGYECIVYDYAANCEVSKAINVGLEWIRYVTNLRWLDNKNYRPIIKNVDVGEHFWKHYKDLKRPTKNKIDYFKKYLNTDKVILYGVSTQSKYDNKYDKFKEILIDKYYNV